MTKPLVGMMIIGLMLALPFFAAADEELPEELENIEALFDDEEALVKAAREFHVTQKALAEADFDQAVELVEREERALAEEKYEEMWRRYGLVRRAYDEVLERYPKNPLALTYMGELLYDTYGEEMEAVEMWRTAVSIDPDLSLAHNNLGIHYCHIGEYERGIEHLDRTLELEPENPDFLFNLAQIYLIHFRIVADLKDMTEKEVFEEAMEMSRKAVEIEPDDFELLQDYALNYFTAENFGVEVDWAEAARAWERAREVAETWDTTFYTWLNEARSWVRDGDHDRARECLEEALEINPNSEAAQSLLAQLDDDDNESNESNE